MLYFNCAYELDRLAICRKEIKMFRKMRRFKQELSKDECTELLAGEKRGVLAVIGDGGYPYAVPVNFYYDENAEKIYFHSAREGHKIDAMNADDRVCFTVFEKEGVLTEDEWSYTVSSVIIFGRAGELIEPERKYAISKSFASKYYSNEEEVMKELEGADYGRMRMNEITIEHMSGKRVHEK